MNRIIPLTLLALLFGVFADGITAASLGQSRLNKKGIEAAKANRSETAIEAFAQALSKDPKNPILQHNLGTALLNQNQFDKATRLLQQAAPNVSDTHKGLSYFSLGNALFHQKEFKKAAAMYQKALAHNPSDTAAKNNLEVALMRLKQQPPSQDPQKNEKDDKKGTNKDKNKDKKPDSPKQNQNNNKNGQPQPPTAPPNPDQNQTPGAQPSPSEAKKRQAEQILGRLEKTEREARLKYLQPPPTQNETVEKDW